MLLEVLRDAKLLDQGWFVRRTGSESWAGLTVNFVWRNRVAKFWLAIGTAQYSPFSLLPQSGSQDQVATPVGGSELLHSKFSWWSWFGVSLQRLVVRVG